MNVWNDNEDEPGAAHKVVFVLNRAPRFAQDSNADLPVLLKEAGKNEMKQVAKMNKTLWSWSIEGALEVHRVVNDIYPNNHRLMRFLVADTEPKFCQEEWGNRFLSRRRFVKSLLETSAPNTGGLDTQVIVKSGLTKAMEALCTLSEHQKKMASVYKENSANAPRNDEISSCSEDDDGSDCEDGELEANSMRTKKKQKETAEPLLSCDGDMESPSSPDPIVELPNSGSIIIYTNYKSDDEIRELERLAIEVLREQNRKVDTGRGESFLSRVNLFVINTFVVGTQCTVSSRSLTQTSKTGLWLWVTSQPAGEPLISGAHAAALAAFDLCSTAVSAIPMKEESQHGQSTNYDVELFHPKSAHNILQRLNLVGPGGNLMKTTERKAYDTISLKWATPSPKTKWNMFPRTGRAFAVTPAVVNSRPSVCLTSFLLQGRNVMLECARVGEASSIKCNVREKLISHTLIAHRGRIYMHAIVFTPLPYLESRMIPVEDPMNNRKTGATNNSCDNYIDVDQWSEASLSGDDEFCDKATSAGTEKVNANSAEESEGVNSSSEDGDSSFESDRASSSSDDEIDKEEEYVFSRDTSLRQTDFVRLMREMILRDPNNSGPSKAEKDKSEVSEEGEAAMLSALALTEAIEMEQEMADEEKVWERNRTQCVQPILRASRLTRYWPLRTDDSVIFQMSKKFEPLLSLIRKKELSVADIDKCKTVFDSLSNLRRNDEPLRLAPGSTLLDEENDRSREEIVMVALTELATYMANYVNHSSSHKDLFETYLKTMGLTVGDSICTDDVRIRLDKVGEAMVDNDDSDEDVKKHSSHKHVKTQPTVADKRSIGEKWLTSDDNDAASIVSPPKKPMFLWKPDEKMSVWDLVYGQKERRQRAEWTDFPGRTEQVGNVATLYKGLDLTTAHPKGQVEPV